MKSPTGVHRPVLVTGATGYIGGRLVPALLAAGFSVRCMVRSRSKLAARSWWDDPRVTIIEGNALDGNLLTCALRGCEAAYYLIHSMMVAGKGYREQDLRLAQHFAQCAAAAALPRIVYLGGLGETGSGLSEHLSSRREVESALASTGVPVTVFRAAMIIGSGSASFEILRYLVERLPVMITPRWVDTECQPISVRNVLHYLVACLDIPDTKGRTLDIGGADVVTYRALMQSMAGALGLRRRRVIPVPVLTPRLSSLWIHLVTPLSHHIARPLTEGLKNRVVCRDDAAQRLMPQPLLSAREAIDLAVGRLTQGGVETAWSDAGAIPGDPDWAGGKVLVDARWVRVAAPPESVFGVVSRIGGSQGYYAANWLWQLRGAMDRLIGGPGLRRGRRDPENVAFGEAVDFWRVVTVNAPHRLTLRAEMKLPGEAELTFEVESDPHDSRASILRQTARFKPRGLAGLAYWYAVVPLHGLVFRGMLNGMRRAAEEPRHAAALVA